MMSINRIFSLITFCVICSGFLSGCLDEIAFDGSENQLENLAIQGKLIRGTPSVVSVSIHKISPFSGFDNPMPVESARVSLLDENGNSVDLLASGPGLFQLEIQDGQAEFVVQEGRAYQIRAVTGAGVVYESELEPLLPVPSPVSVDIELTTRGEINEAGNIVENAYLQFYINTPLSVPNSGQNSFLKWDMEGCYRFIETTPNSPAFPKTCYNKEAVSLGKVKVFNGSESSAGGLISRSLLLETEQDYRFSQGYYLTVYQQSLSENAFQYWDEARQLVERSGSFFEPAPGKIRGNIRNPDNPEEDVFGYFYATVQDTFRLRVRPEDAFYPSPYCLSSFADGERNAVCYDCLLRPNSTLEKPDYWED